MKVLVEAGGATETKDVRSDLPLHIAVSLCPPDTEAGSATAVGADECVRFFIEVPQ